MKKLYARILTRMACKCSIALPVVVSEPAEWTKNDEAWLRHILGQASGKKLYALLAYTPMTEALSGNEKTPFENGKVAGAARVLQQLQFLCGSPILDALEDDQPGQDSKTQ